MPDIAGLVDICRRFGATLMVDAAHDLGAIGPTGRGFLERQGMAGRPDVLMGSFSKAFASNGGVRGLQPSGAEAGPALLLRPAHLLQPRCRPFRPRSCSRRWTSSRRTKAVSAARRLLANANRLLQPPEIGGLRRSGRAQRHRPSDPGGTALSRLATRYALEVGALVNLVEHPAVSMNTCRWRLQVMADHTGGQLDEMACIAAMAREKAADDLRPSEAFPIELGSVR